MLPHRALARSDSWIAHPFTKPCSTGVLSTRTCSSRMGLNSVLRFCPAWVNIHWRSCESRRSHDPPIKHDLNNPVQLHMPVSEIPQQPRPTVELQSLILTWHEENEWLQALSASPAVLCLQICRGTAPSSKCKAPIAMSGLTVHVPCYTGVNLEVVWSRCQS